MKIERKNLAWLLISLSLGAACSGAAAPNQTNQNAARNVAGKSADQTENVKMKDANAANTESSTPSEKTSAENEDWITAATKKKPQGDNEAENYGLLRNVRSGKHQGYDRVVFEFAAPDLTGYEIQFAAPPFSLGESDETVSIAGKAFLQVVFTPAAAHTLEGEATVAEVKQDVNSDALVQIYRTYDHEGQVIYILGLTGKTPYRVQELKNPTRLVIDVRH